MFDTFIPSETLLIAFITFLSGAIGAVVGAISTYLVAKRSSDTELKKFLYKERLIAYSQFMEDYLALSSYIATLSVKSLEVDSTSEYLSPEERLKERELYSRFNTSCSKAGLLSSYPTLLTINELLKSMGNFLVTHRQPPNMNEDYKRTVDAMRSDLTLHKNSILETQEPKKNI